jgi:hypothetical protein
MPTTLPERCAQSHEKESSFSSVAGTTFLLILAAFFSILIDLSAGTQRSITYPIDGRIYFP